MKTSAVHLTSRPSLNSDMEGADALVEASYHRKKANITTVSTPYVICEGNETIFNIQAWDSSQAHEPSESVTSGNHAVYTMENILSSLNSLAETWLTFGSASYHIDLSCTLQSVLGLLLLYICYLILKLILQSLWKGRYTQKRQEEAEETRGALEGEGIFQRAKERGELQTTRQSPLRELYHGPRYERRLHPDPLFIVSRSTTHKVSHLVSQATLEDGSISHFCLASTAPVTETSFIVSTQLTANQPGHPAPAMARGPLPLTPSILSPNRLAPLESLLSSTTLGDFLMPESMLPVKPTPPYALDAFPFPTKEAREPEVVFQLESTRSKVPTTKGTGYGSQPVSYPSHQWPGADNPLSSDLAYSFHQHLRDPRASQAPLQGAFPEPGHLLPPSSDALGQIKRQEEKGGDSLAAKYKENREFFLKASRSLEKPSSAPSLSKPQDLAASRWASSKGKRMRSKTSESDAEPKPIQLFWGPPSLHSEALYPTPTASRDRSSAFVGFNSMAEASVAATSPLVILPTPSLGTMSQPQTWGQALSQGHSQRDPCAQPQPQPHSPVPVLTFSPQSQLRVCGVHFHRHQEEAAPLGPSETQRLEYNVLKKEQERVWGLPSVVQKSQDTFCPSPPKLSLTSQPFKSLTPRPILLGDFPLPEELRKKLEHHLRKRLIQHRWGLPHRINVSLSLMCPQSELVDFSESERSHGLSWISVFKHRGSKNSHGIVLSGSGKFRNEISEAPPAEEAEVRAQAYTQDRLQRNVQEVPGSSLKSDLKKEQERHAGSPPGLLSSPSQVSQHQQRIENALEEHLSKKMKEIHECQIPATVKRSWHSINVAQPPLETTPGPSKHLAPLAGEEDPPEKQQCHLSFSPSKEKMLEEHIKTFGKRMRFGLPQRVESSLDTYMRKVEPSHSLSRPHVPPPTASGGSSRSPQRNTSGDRMGTMNPKPLPETPLPVSSPGSQRQPASENKKVLADKDLSIAQSGREAGQLWSPSMGAKRSLRPSGSVNRHSPELPMGPDGPTEERPAPSTNTKRPPGERKSWEVGSTAEGSTELLKGEEPPGLHPQSTKGTCSPVSHGTTCQPPQEMSVPHNPEPSDYKSQVSREVVLCSVSGPLLQEAGLPHVPLASEEMTSKRQGPSGGDMAASQVLQVHLPTVGVSVEPLQGPWFPAYVSGKCQNKQCPPAASGVSPLTAEAGKFGGGDAGLGTSQTMASVQARAPAETHGHTSSPAPSPKGQPLENQFNNQGRCFGQWTSPGRKLKGEEKSRAKGSSPSPPVKGTSFSRGRYEFYGNNEVQKCVRDPGVIFRKLEPKHGTVISCPEETQQEIQVQAKADPAQRHHSCCQTARSQGQRAESCSPGQGQTAPGRCGIAGKAEMVATSQRARVPPKTYL